MSARAATLALDLAGALEDARERTLALVDDLTDEQLSLPCLSIVNPVLWELGHVAWFQEKWCLRRDGRPSMLARADRLFDSAAVAHDTRWGLDLPSRAETLAYLRATLDATVDRIASRRLGPNDDYFLRLALFHEDMHGEAMLYTRQTLAYTRPRLGETTAVRGGALAGDADVPGGTYRLGAEREAKGEFAFDNEKWAHDVVLEPFRIARAPVTESEFAEFVEANGYSRREFWSDEGWAWRVAADARLPVYWRREGERSFSRRDFDAFVPLDPAAPVAHVNAHEAEAYCRYVGRRLPTEAEWEAAALAEPGATGFGRRRRFPWGDDDPTPDRAALDVRSIGRADVGALPAGDSAFGCRQMIGNVWEWTSTAFHPYPGFAPDAYAEYSAPWFGNHRVLRGGCFATRARLLRGTWRNFYTPDRRDVFAGFRTATHGH